MRHIIIEGPDGSGKTTLFNYLLDRDFTFQPHKRASTSVGGPVSDLEQWVVDDMVNLSTAMPSVYDRHPLISEPIYGPTCRGRAKPPFGDMSWVFVQQEALAKEALVIFCCPPLTVVRENVRVEQQMPGVAANLAELFALYQLASLAWPGVQIRYDYTRHNQGALLNHIDTIFGRYADVP